MYLEIKMDEKAKTTTTNKQTSSKKYNGLRPKINLWQIPNQNWREKYQTKCTSSGVTSFPVFMSKTLWSTASRLTTESGSAVTVTSRSAWGSDMLVDILRLTYESHVLKGQVDKRF